MYLFGSFRFMERGTAYPPLEEIFSGVNSAAKNWFLTAHQIIG